MVNNPPAYEYKEESNYMIYEEPGDDTGDWMTALLRHPVFHRLPPANLQKILMGLELVEIEKGSSIIEQGGPGDYYYLLKSGQCLITRKPAPNMKEIKLGLLEKGETFGEDSLITGAPRSVTVTAMTDVSLLRLNKEQFVSLIKEPTLKYIDYEELDNAVKQGASLLDIRTPDEYEKRHIEGSVNVPYFSLRMQFKNLSRDKKAIVICDDGRASEAGAFLLLNNNFNAFILRDGMQSAPLEQENESAEFTIDDGIETLNNIQDYAPKENRLDGAEDPLSGSPQAPIDDQIRFLKSEIDVLRRINQQLNEKCMRLEIEKESINKHFQT
ncbi:MAG: cyclic nucleotide-binding domain-containing protein, partial [Gammaproteobacteria bacterium]